MECVINFDMIHPLVNITAANKKLLIVAPAVIGSTLEKNCTTPKKNG